MKPASVKLSDRVRPGCEAPAWVVAAIKVLESRLEKLERGSSPSCICPVCGQLVVLRKLDGSDRPWYRWVCVNACCIVGADFENNDEAVAAMSALIKKKEEESK